MSLCSLTCKWMTVTLTYVLRLCFWNWVSPTNNTTTHQLPLLLSFCAWSTQQNLTTALHGSQKSPNHYYLLVNQIGKELFKWIEPKLYKTSCQKFVHRFSQKKIHRMKFGVVQRWRFHIKVGVVSSLKNLPKTHDNTIYYKFFPIR